MLRWSMMSLIAACAPLSSSDAEDRLADALSKAVGKGGVRHGVLHVDAPALGVSGTWVAGEAREGEPMATDTPFLSASIGKLFTAVTLVSLAEEGTLNLSDSVTDWLSPEQLAGLPVADGHTLSEVSLEHLLTHRSGLPDYFVGKTRDRAPTVLEQWQSDPDRSWTRQQMLDHVRDHQDAVGAPGEVFEYADTNYTLLGLVIESATGRPSFQDVVHERVLAPLELSKTRYHHTVDGERVDGTWAQVWSGDVPLGDAACLSGDLAGGGLVTTTGDLATFLRALDRGELVDPATLQQQVTEDALSRGIDYGLGQWRIRPKRVSFALGGAPLMFGASGSTGSFAYHVPEWDAVIVGTFDQTDQEEKHLRWVLTKVIPTLTRIDADR